MIQAFNVGVAAPNIPLEAWCSCQNVFYNGMIIGGILFAIMIISVYLLVRLLKDNKILVDKEEEEDNDGHEDEFYNGEET